MKQQVTKNRKNIEPWFIIVNTLFLLKALCVKSGASEETTVVCILFYTKREAIPLDNKEKGFIDIYGKTSLWLPFYEVR